MFRWNRDPPQEWVDTLHRFAPASKTEPWLKLVWFPGEDYEPVQRWCIYEMFPLDGPLRDWAPQHVLEALEGPNPRNPDQGRWISSPDDGGKRWVSFSCISLLQWNLYRETNCLPVLFWIVQGKYGGHKWVLSPSEQKLLKLKTDLSVSDTPCPGDLPYAPFDGRVMKMLYELNALHTKDQQIMLRKKRKNKALAGLIVRKQRSNQEQEARQQLSNWLEIQVKQSVEILEPQLKKIWDQIPDGDRHYDKDIDRVEEAFITETSTLAEA